MALEAMKNQMGANFRAFFAPLVAFLVSMLGQTLFGVGLLGLAMADLLPFPLGLVLALFSIAVGAIGWQMAGTWNRLIEPLGERLRKAQGS